MTRPPVCGCCNSACDPFDSAILLGHVPAHYFRCPSCGLVRTEEPTWLEEAYSRPITSLDIGLLGRCVHLANVTEAVVRSLSGDAKCLDWAGGYGVLTRLLRDRGLDFHHYDPHTSNLFAAGLEGDPTGPWDLITLYEVLEHLTDPYDQLSTLAAAAPVLLFTTELLPDPTPSAESWWYYSLETGQHVTFYTVAGLAGLAARLGMSLVTDGKSLHALYRPGSFPRRSRWIVQNPRLSRVLALGLRRARPTRSLLDDDFEAVRRSLRSQ